MKRLRKPEGDVLPKGAAVRLDTLPEDAFQGRMSKPLSCTICGNIFPPFRKQPELCITQIIQEQQDESGTYWGSRAS